VEDLTHDAALLAGGWDPRYAHVVAISQRGDVAGVLVDSNGDGADVDLDEYRRVPDGMWQEGISGSVSDSSAGWSPDMVWICGTEPAGTEVAVRYRDVEELVMVGQSGWWLFVAPTDPRAPDALPERIREQPA
jgi:hypothetical protein